MTGKRRERGARSEPKASEERAVRGRPRAGTRNTWG